MYPQLPSSPTIYDIVRVVNLAMQGKLNATESVALPTDASTTTMVDDMRVTPNSVITFMPKTANASAELYGGAMYVSDRDRDNKQFTITHSNSGVANRDFDYVLIG